MVPNQYTRNLYLQADDKLCIHRLRYFYGFVQKILLINWMKVIVNVSIRRPYATQVLVTSQVGVLVSVHSLFWVHCTHVLESVSQCGWAASKKLWGGQCLYDVRIMKAEGAALGSSTD